MLRLDRRTSSYTPPLDGVTASSRSIRLSNGQSRLLIQGDCSAIDLLGQTNMRTERTTNRKGKADATAWQSLPFTWCLLAIASGWFASPVAGQLYDALDTHPPRWHLATSDCDARITKQSHLITGGVAGGACESIHFTASNGTEAKFVYLIEPVLPLDDLTANVKVMSARPGASIGFRIRFPYLKDPATKKPVSVTVYGASYQSAGEFAAIGVGLIEKPLRLKHVSLRSEYGVAADLSDSYVDAIVINAYSGPGKSAIRIDELRVDGLIPVGDQRGENETPSLSRLMSEPLVEGKSQQQEFLSPFPSDTVTRILQHNGEPLAWVRSLGFDAVLLNDPPDANLLREAIQTRIQVYAPPPSAPDPALQSLLDPVAGWYLGSREVLDSRRTQETQQLVQRLRLMPTRWRRPLLGAPAESWPTYAKLLDGVIDDLPPRVRSLRASEEVTEMIEVRRKIGNRTANAIGVTSMPPESLLRQSHVIADAVGVPRPDGFHWHSMWLQTMRSLEVVPAAILFRSTRQLSSGRPIDSQRAMALSYINRMIAMIAPWVSTAKPASPPTISDGNYRCSRLSNGSSDLLIFTSEISRGSEILAGDGQTLELQLTPADANKTLWRLTHFSAERLTPEMTETGPRLQIVSPDATEILCLSSDPRVGGQFAASAGRFARQATLDRWQLVNDSLQRSRSRWVSATSMGVLPQGQVSNLVGVAERTLDDAEPLFRAGDLGSSIRMARRADAWILRSDWQLAEALMPNWPRLTSCPPVAIGATEIQTFWYPLMNDDRWGKNRLASGSLDEAAFFGEGRWEVGKRLLDRAECSVDQVTRSTLAGSGALRASVVSLKDDPLRGGYEGTVVHIQSPSVRVQAGKAIRIDAWVKTIGFGGPHQGVLVYDTICGQELGVLVRGRPDWTPVRLYRQAENDGEVKVMFEIIGAGEAMIDEVELRIWEPNENSPLPFRPITPAIDDNNLPR